MREWWANVYPSGPGRVAYGGKFESREVANEVHRITGGPASKLSTFRIHVRVKPEGAPRRYASEADRMRWESDPKTMRQVSEKLADYMREARARWAPYRTGLGGTD